MMSPIIIPAMPQEIPKVYNPKDTEPKWESFWLEKGLSHAEVSRGRKSYSIVIPPPNVTGILHMGHALNNTIQDILIRQKRMQGFNALWMPGTDHAGIATQNVVEKKLAKQKKSRKDIGREAFLKEVWAWKEEHGNTIIRQLKRMGCSCDWPRERFTMDEGLSKAVVEVFQRLYQKGLIYRGNYIINWCPRCQTALSDEEAEHREMEGALYYIHYAIEGEKDTVTVATTRPETMLGDVAVAVNPKDERYAHLKGKSLILPILQRRLKIVFDDFVDPQFGTGAVKVTPAHDPNDFAIAGRHGLDPINVMHDDGTMNENAGDKYEGMDRFECREALVLDLKERKLLEKVVPHHHAVGHCYRCHTVVEPRLSKQWFVKMKPLAAKAIEVVRSGKVKFYPDRWTKVYLDWMENIRDWCISRQIWWGHRIPVWYCVGDTNCKLQCKEPIVSTGEPKACPHCGSKNLRQDPDVLDTWFSSWLWPFSTFGWPEESKDLKFYYPTNALVTAQEIIFFWVARMIMAGLEFRSDAPFREVYIHGTVRDATGTKMSKSLGNTIDPVEIIEQYGADALRFSLIVITSQGQDVFLSKDKFEMGRNFANKIWNASRFLLLNLEPLQREKVMQYLSTMTAEDIYIIGKLNLAIQQVTQALSEFRFNEAALTAYDFFWHDFCDRYVESAKIFLYGDAASAQTSAPEQAAKGGGDSSRDKERTQFVLYYVLESSLRLLHPFMPFVTEEIWQKLRETVGGLPTAVYPKDPAAQPISIMTAPWPQCEERQIDRDTIARVENKYEVIRVGRNLRTEYQVPPSQEVEFVIKPADANAEKFLMQEREFLSKFLKASKIDIQKDFKPNRPMVANLCVCGTVYLVLEGVLDVNQERQRLEKSLTKLDQELSKMTERLANPSFRDKAPKEIIQEQEGKQKELQEKIGKLRMNLKLLVGHG